MTASYLRWGAFVLALFASIGEPSAQQDTRRLTVAAKNDAGRRVALIIGNDTYQGAALKNARNDARALSEVLKDLQFDVEVLEDVTREQFTRKFSEFSRSLTASDVAMFFFAGHGVQIDGENYLLPVDFRGASVEDVRWNSIKASDVQRDLERARVAVLMFDACRNNPFLGGRAAGTGLVSMEARGSLIAFATGAGKTASDNSSARNGLFTQHLVEVLRTPGLSVSDVFKRVRQGVYAASSGQQWPAVYDGLLGDFVLRPAAPAVTIAPSTTAVDEPAGLIPSLRWVGIPGGALTLGCPPSERQCDFDEERSPTPVRVGPFRMLDTEVTVAQFRKFTTFSGVDMPPKASGDPLAPVTGVTWTEANAFCQALSSDTMRVRLPTEAEWELAARAGSSTIYPWGDRYERRENGLGAEDGHTNLAPVRSFQENALGLFDMLGNAREWVQDWYEPKAHQQAAGIDPAGPASSSVGQKVARGGSFMHYPTELRVSTRKGYPRDARWDFIGFRCAATGRAR